MQIKYFLFSIVLLLNSSESYAQLFKNKAKVQIVPTSCSSTPLSERPVLTVSRFDVKAYKAQQRFGSELGAMLSNALVETNCFNVLASSSDMSDIAGEMAVSQQFGGGNSESKGVKSADYFISGEVTEFNENSVGTNTLGIQIGLVKAQIGFILQIKNAQREILFSKSINVTRSKPGTGGIRLFGLPVATGSFTSKAMADALENGIIQAVNIIGEQKDLLGMSAPVAGEGSSTPTFDPRNCGVLKTGNAPKVMVVIPEYHIQRKIPDPAGETEIIKLFVNAGFPVVDPTMYMALKTNGTLSAIVDNPVEAANIGAKYGADIIIIGEAFSEASGNVNGMVSCRARVEARAINTKNATIVAADGKHGSGLDIAESVSAKVALRNAGTDIANSFMSRLCGNQSSTISGQSGGGSSQQLLVRNIDYGTLSTLSGIVSKVNGVNGVSKNYAKGDGTLQFQNSGGIDKIVDAIMSSSLGSSLEVDQFKEDKVVLLAR